MAQIVGLPKLSPTMEEGVLAKWTKKEGDSVSPGDVIAEVETDKANMDFTLEDAGTLLKLLVREGDTVRLGAPVAILGKPGDAIEALVAQAMEQIKAGAGAPAPAAAAAAPGAKPAPAVPSPAASAPGNGRKPQVAAAPPPRPAPAPRPVPPAPAPAPVAAAAAAAAPSAPPTGSALLASPLAKTLAAENGIDLRGVAGSGPGGRIVERDVLALLDAGATSAATAVPPPASHAMVPAARAVALVPADGADYTDTALSPMRKTIARRLVEAKSTIPHFYLTTHVDAAPLRRFREELNGVTPEDEKISVNDLLVKAVALALVRFPAVNAAFVGDAIRQFHRVHVGVAVSIEDGLLTPVVFDADILSLRGVRATIRDLAARAKTKKLRPEEMSGSTFTVSNLGMYGIDHFEAIINPPESCILAVGRTQTVPVVDKKTGQIVAGERMGLTLSCDHRVVDGALGARFMGVLTELLEHPASLAL